MKKEKCEHEHITVKVYGYQDFWFDTGWDSVSDLTPIVSTAQCASCDKFLTKKERQKINLE